MKKHSVSYIVFALPVILILLAYTTGSPGGYSGSPGDSGISCTNCHSGTAQLVNGWITTNVPVSGYKAGEVYNRFDYLKPDHFFNPVFVHPVVYDLPYIPVV